MRWDFGYKNYYSFEFGQLFEGYFYGMLFIVIVNFLVVTVCGPMMERFYPKDLGFRELYDPFHTLSVLQFLPLLLIISEESEGHVRASACILFIMFGSLQVSYSLAIVPKLTLVWETRSFKNLNDTNVDILKTFYLATYHDCCFIPDEEFPPPLDCITKNNTEPCFDDVELFEEFLDNIGFSSKKCLRLTGLDLRENRDGGPTRGICDRSERSFVKKIGNTVYRRLWATLLVVLISGAATLLASSEIFLAALSDW